MCDLYSSWALICLRKQLINQDLQRKTIRTVFGSLLGLPEICTHSYLPVLGFMTLITINKSEHKADLLLNTLELKKKKQQKTVVRLLFSRYRLHIFRKVLGSQQNWENRTEISHVSSPIINISHHSGTFVITDEPTATHHNHPKSIVYILGYSCVVHSVDLDKCMTCIYHRGIIQGVSQP